MHFIIDLEGKQISPAEEALLKHPHVGGLLLFTRNFNDRTQLIQLTNHIRSIRSDITIAVDQEGGFVQRLQRQGFRALPAARVYGDTYDIDPAVGLQLAQKYGAIMAEDLHACGIDLGLSPVLDLQGPSHVIGGLDRAFHADPDVVTQLATAFIEGMHSKGMPSVGKHFPGHGSCVLDSHLTLPFFDASEAQLRATDLKPFINLIKNKQLDAVMPAHIVYKSIDPDHPAGFSKRWLQAILRTELGFDGLIMSDCLSMAGADIGSLKTRSDAALAAGCDMLIVSNQPRDTLLELVQSVSNENEASTQRILAFKQKMCPKETIDGQALPSSADVLTQSPSNSALNRTTAV